MVGVLFVHDTAAGLLFGATSAVVVAVEVSDVRVRRRHDDRVRDHGTARVFAVAMAVAIAGSLTSALVLPGTVLPGGWLTLSFGLAAVWAGLGLNRWARYTLGRAYRPVVTIVDRQQVVTGGPYRMVRHPMYSGAIVMCVGFGLIIGTWPSMVFWLMPPAALVRRLLVEERVLSEELGSGYQEFRDGRSRLIPGLW